MAESCSKKAAASADTLEGEGISFYPFVRYNTGDFSMYLQAAWMVCNQFDMTALRTYIT